jgi:hypothetical protein
MFSADILISVVKVIIIITVCKLKTFLSNIVQLYIELHFVIQLIHTYI